jgi:hypothetical protein
VIDMLLRVGIATFLLASSALAQSVVISSGSEEQVLAGAQVMLAPAGMSVQSGGKLTILGSGSGAGAQGVITSGVTAGVPMTVLSQGTIDFKFGKLESVTTLTANSGAIVLRIHDTVFTDLAGLNPGATAWLDLSAMTAGDRANLLFSFNRVSSRGLPPSR